jgi:hypothetical protein
MWTPSSIDSGFPCKNSLKKERRVHEFWSPYSSSLLQRRGRHLPPIKTYK